MVQFHGTLIFLSSKSQKRLGYQALSRKVNCNIHCSRCDLNKSSVYPSPWLSLLTAANQRKNTAVWHGYCNGEGEGLISNLNIISSIDPFYLWGQVLAQIFFGLVLLSSPNTSPIFILKDGLLLWDNRNN